MKIDSIDQACQEIYNEFKSLNASPTQAREIGRAVLPTYVKKFNELVLKNLCSKETAFDKIVEFSEGLEIK